MDIISDDSHKYLHELYRMTAGDVATQVSMYDVGTALGLEKGAAGKAAEDLIGNGLAEVKTLSGGIGITVGGIEKVLAEGGAGETVGGRLDLGNGPMLEEKGRKAVETILTDIQSHLSQNPAVYDQIEDIVIDIKTMEVQMLSSRPKTAIVREVLRSLQATLKAAGNGSIAEKIENMM